MELHGGKDVVDDYHLDLRSLIGTMSPRKQVVLALISAGYTQEDCGKILGITRAAAGYILKTALKEMRVSLYVS